MSDRKPPRNEHELELALVRLMGGDNGKMLSMRSMMANAIVGQFLPDGAILKGGGSLRFRYGSSFTRNTKDFDATRKGDLDGFLKSLRTSLGDGWCGFTGECKILPQANPKDVPFDYVMQPVEIGLKYRNNPWCRVDLEISHSEAGATESCDWVPPPAEVVEVFDALGFPHPRPVPLITLEHQLAQKLHGASGESEKNGRAHDLIDIQLIVAEGKVDLSAVKRICLELYRQRRRQGWPTLVTKHKDWDALYDEKRRGLNVLDSVDGAIEFVNDLIRKIDAS